MSQLSDFNTLAQSGQELSRESLFPATIIIAGRKYSASKSGLSSELDMHGGDFRSVRRMAFTVTRAQFITAAQPAPVPEIPLRWEEGNLDLLIKTVEPDATDTIFTLRCEAPPQ